MIMDGVRSGNGVEWEERIHLSLKQDARIVEGVEEYLRSRGYKEFFLGAHQHG